MTLSPDIIRLPLKNVEVRYKKGTFLADNVRTAVEDALKRHPNSFNVPQDTFVTLSRSNRSSVLAGIQEPSKKGQVLEEAAEPVTGSYPEAVNRIFKRIVQELADR